MKAFTSIEQSKKLAEILPLESADMHLTNSSIRGEMYIGEFKPALVPYLLAKDSLDAYSKIVNNMIAWEVIPCWSLAALLSVLPDYTMQTNTDGTVFVASDSKKPMISDAHDNPIDACYEMIIELHEQNML